MLRGLLRIACGGAAALVLAVAAAPAASQARSSDAPSVRALLGAINHERAKRHLRPLRLSRPLGAAARQHSREMAQRGYFAHTSADGSSFSKRIVRFYSTSGFRRWSAGENILYSTPPLTAAQAVSMWMHSPGHRRNILTRAWREIGISAVAAAAAPGVYEGRSVVIVTTDFGVRTR